MAEIYENVDNTPQANGMTASKRKSVDGSGTNTRAKRNRYISIACNECKRRKIKCNGETPCQRCGNLSLECLYAPNCCSTSVKDSEEFQQMREHILSLQEHVDNLYVGLNALRERQDTFLPAEPAYSYDGSRSISTSRTLPPLVSPSRPPKAIPQFHGPTSSAYGFDVAKSTLETMGINQDSGAEETGNGDEGSRTPAPVIGPLVAVHPSKDPIWTIPQSEAIRLCRVYEEEVGIMYPLFDIEHIIRHIKSLYTFIEAAIKTGFTKLHLPGSGAIEDDDTNVVKMMLAIALIMEGNGESELGQKIFNNMRPIICNHIIDKTDIRGLVLIVMAAIFRFQREQEAQAWRLIGIAARLCIEMGLHRNDALLKTFTNEGEYLDAVRVFWIVYALDRRWSFGTGMPFALQDADIDSFLPEVDDSKLYLKNITKYNRIASKVWIHNLAFEAGNDTKRAEIGFLDYQVQQWYQQLPESLKFNAHDIPSENAIPDRGRRRLRFLMFLRVNQARIHIYRPILMSAISIMEHRHYAQTIVDVAKETISVVTRISQTTDIYRTQQVCYNYFLVQALAVIFLAVSHAPAEFCPQTREEFYGALDLIKGFSTRSYTSKRLWKTIRGLKDLGEKIGLWARRGNGSTDLDDAHSNAAMAMAGLAGHSVDPIPMYSSLPRHDSMSVSPLDGQQISNELTNLFELAGGYGNVAGSMPEGFNGYGGPNGEIPGGTEGVTTMFGSEQEFGRIMGELF